jgi:hypothetical protein
LRCSTAPLPLRYRWTAWLPALRCIARTAAGLGAEAGPTGSATGSGAGWAGWLRPSSSSSGDRRWGECWAT